MKTANINLIQFINFLLAKTTNSMIPFFTEVNFVQIRVNSHETSWTGYLPFEINWSPIDVNTFKLKQTMKELPFCSPDLQLEYRHQHSGTSVSGMTKPDNLLTGFILLLMVERRSGNFYHHPNFAICLFIK